MSNDLGKRACGIRGLVTADVVNVLLTVPDLTCTASPWREMMGLAKYLPKERFRLTVCSLRANGIDETSPLLGQLGVPCFVARFRPRGRKVRHFLGVLKDMRALRSAGPFDIQHSMDFTSSPIEALASVRHASRFVFTQRNMNLNGSRTGLKIKTRWAATIACVSEAVKRYVQELASYGRYKVIYPGLDAVAVRPASPASRPSRPFRIVMVSNLVPLKRIRDGVVALSRLAQDPGAIRLDLVGAPMDSRYVAYLKSEIDRLRLTACVRFLGPRSDVIELMGNYDALLHTAESEAFGVTLIEAMAVGLPVIAPDIQGPSESIEDGVSGLLVPVGDVAGYAGALRKLMESPELAQNLAAAGRKRVETHFTARRMAEEYAEFYEAACQ